MKLTQGKCPAQFMCSVACFISPQIFLSFGTTKRIWIVVFTALRSAFFDYAHFSQKS